ncbi:HET-domain-containing protein [Apiospora sp. TS-2023a]
MLCKSCLAHFILSRPDLVAHILDIKKLAIEAAQKKELDETGADSEKTFNPATPCPYNIDDRHEYTLYSGAGVLSIWNSGDHERTWGDLEASAKSGNCHMCQTIVAMTLHATGTGTSENQTIASTVFMDDVTCQPAWIRVDVARDGIRVAMLSFHISIQDAASVDLGTSTPLKSPIGVLTDNESIMEFCSRAMETCLAEHEACRTDERDPWLPTRLLDLRPSLCPKGAIRVVQTDDLLGPDRANGVQYLTLSHTWGHFNPISLTISNLREMEEGIRFEDLPRRLQDTALQQAYLFFSIIQDSPEDWAKESSVMDKVYRYGICNISACNGKDSTASPFAVREPKSGAPIVFTHTYSDCAVRFSIIPDYVDLARRHARLYSRGWVLQERLLSLRIINFARFLSWECHTCLETETYDGSLTRQRLGFPVLPVSERDWGFASDSSVYPTHAARWWRLVQIYTRSQLTRQSDKLIAIAGLAQAFSAVIREP